MKFQPFVAILLFFYNSFKNYGAAILCFGLVVKIILLPFQMKTKKSTMRTTMLQPRLKELERQCGSNKEKYQQEVARLYKEAKVNPLSGCLWSLIPFPILIALYSAVRQPLSKLMSLTAEQVGTLTQVATDLGYYTAAGKKDAYVEMTVANALHEHFAEFTSAAGVSEFASSLKDINFSFLTMNLSQKPRLFFWEHVEDGRWLPVVLMFLIPFVSAGLTVLQTKLSTKMTNNGADPQAAQTAKTMNTFMPLMSVYICFIMPAAMGLYWIEQSVLGIIQEFFLNKYYQKKIDAEMAEFNALQKAKEEELARKRAETERLKAEGKTQVNASTSKRRLAAQERNAQDLRQAEKRAADRAARGIVDEVPDSQVDTRRFARGRAYESDRFERMAEEALETAEEAAGDGRTFSRGRAYVENRFDEEAGKAPTSKE